MIVTATDEFRKQNKKPKELDYIPKEGEEFEVTEERYRELALNNKYKVAFVEKSKRNKPLDLNLKKSTKKTLLKEDED